MSDTDTPKRRALRLETEIDATPDAVWRSLSDPDELIRWFPVAARVEPGVGGSIWLSWGPGCEGEAPITAWEPGRRLRWEEQMPPEEEGGEPVTLAVDFEIEARGGKTVVRLVQSGFGDGDEWDDYYDALERGWTYFLWNLRNYLERHAGTPRDLVWLRRRAGAPHEEIWRRLLGPEGLGVAGAGGVPAPGEPFSLSLGGDAPQRGTVHLTDQPWIFAGRVESLDHATLFVELEGGGDNWHCGLYLSTYGLPKTRVEELQRALDAVAGRVLA